MKKCSLVITILIVLILIATGCVKSQTPTPSNVKEVVITFERTAGFGTCPIYKLAIHGDGAVIYEGIRFVKIEGTITTATSEDRIKQLISEFQKIDSFP